MANPPYNPYQPPKFDDIIPNQVAGDFDLGRAVTDAWEATKHYFPLWLGVMVVGWLAMLFAAVTVIGIVAVVPVIAWGMVKFHLNMKDGRADFSDLFSGFSNYGPVLGKTLVLGAVWILLSLIGDSLALVGQFTKSGTLSAIGTMVNLVFAFAIMTRLYFAFFLVIDKDMAAIDALGASWQMTQGKVLKVIALSLLAGLIAGAGVIACCVGALFTVTMSYVMYASAYRQMVGPPEQLPGAPIPAAWAPPGGAAPGGWGGPPGGAPPGGWGGPSGPAPGGWGGPGGPAPGGWGGPGGPPRT
jgi:hypothetical protein